MIIRPAEPSNVFNIDDYRHHEVTPCTCTSCGKKCLSVALPDAPWPRECPDCKTMTVVEE